MKLLKFLLPVVLLTGCASAPVTENVTRHGSFPAAAALPADWQLQGRISLTQGETGWHAGVDWTEQAGYFRMRVAGPLGQGGFLLTGNGVAVELQDAEQRRYRAPDADTLLHNVTGWNLPVTGLRYWVRGIPDPDSPFEATTDSDGRLTLLSQDGWAISYRRYHKDALARWPALLSLLRDDVKVRLVVDHWAFGQAGDTRP